MIHHHTRGYVLVVLYPSDMKEVSSWNKPLLTLNNITCRVMQHWAVTCEVPVIKSLKLHQLNHPKSFCMRASAKYLTCNCKLYWWGSSAEYHISAPQVIKAQLICGACHQCPLQPQPHEAEWWLSLLHLIKKLPVCDCIIITPQLYLAACSVVLPRPVVKQHHLIQRMMLFNLSSASPSRVITCSAPACHQHNVINNNYKSTNMMNAYWNSDTPAGNDFFPKS